MRRIALSFALALCFSASLWAQAAATSSGGATAPSYQISEPELARCRAISLRLVAISSELESKLSASAETLTRLSAELAASRSELAELRASLETSQTRSAELEQALASADSSLKSLTASFAAYKSAAESRIRLWRWVAIGAGAVATGALVYAAVK